LTVFYDSDIYTADTPQAMSHEDESHSVL
jgi:hypothetical protein